MSQEIFYHYTSTESANNIVYQGKILPSLKVNGDAVYGEGVYLTTLEPRHGPGVIRNNNWDGVAATRNNIEVYFEIMMPTSKVKRANDTRDIQVHKGPLVLSEYRWSLKDWDGQLLATQYFMISSKGMAKIFQGSSNGRYSLARDIVMSHSSKESDRTFVYKNDEGTKYLYRNYSGNWVVGKIAGDIRFSLLQTDEGTNHPSPPKILPWKYYNDGWRDDDKTLKVFPCYF